MREECGDVPPVYLVLETRKTGGTSPCFGGRAFILLNARLNDPLQGGLGLALGMHENVHFPLLIG